MSPLKIKIPSKILSKQHCAEEFNSRVEGLNVQCQTAYKDVT
jgi:hypothetical protein